MFYSIEELGPHQSRLPSGTLWCRDVVIARTGEQAYHHTELPMADVDSDSDGMLRVQRDESEVFNERAMTSFEGVPVVMMHPALGDVTSTSWASVAVGHVQNIRRDGDHLIADLFIHDARAIDAIRNRGAGVVSVAVMMPDTSRSVAVVCVRPTSSATMRRYCRQTKHRDVATSA